jgi:hypothetical protein
MAGEEHVGVLLARPEPCRRLELLRLKDRFLGEAQVLRLARCGAPENLRVLDLRSSARSQISPDVADALRGAPQFGRTQVML